MADLGFIEFEELPMLPVPGYVDIQQNTDEWYRERAGKITASRISDMLAGGNGETRKKMLYELAIERLTGKPVRGGFESRSIRHGKAYEDEALDLYSLRHGHELKKVGFINHPTLPMCGCSPDILVIGGGMAQVKAPDQHTHLETLLTRNVPRAYALQMQWEMACACLEWNDFVSYDPDQNVRLQLVVIRQYRNGDIIKNLEDSAIRLNLEIENLVEKLKQP